MPAAVIVTVGAGAVMMLTGRANDMLAERASTGTLSSGQASGGAVSSGQASGKATATGGAAAGTTGLALPGYPGEHGRWASPRYGPRGAPPWPSATRTPTRRSGGMPPTALGPSCRPPRWPA